MAINVNDLELPTVDLKFMPSEKNVYEQMHHALSVSKESWLAKTMFGYAIIRHKDVNAILKDKRWHNGLTQLIDANPNTSEEYKDKQKKSLILLERENSTRIKRLVTPAFQPASIDKHRENMRKCLLGILDSLTSNEIDLQKDLFNKYAVMNICELLGAPKEDWELFQYWSESHFKNYNVEFDKNKNQIIKDHKDFNKYTIDLIEKRRKNLTDDLLSDLIRAEDEGNKLTMGELMMLIESILVGGIDTGRSQLGLTTLMLSGMPDLWKKLHKDRDLTAKAVEESIRLDGVLKNNGRYASEDIEYNGVLFPKGTSLYIYLSSANRDDAVFENPHEFNLNRGNSIHHTMAYAAGVHYCLGVSMARAEIQEAMMILSERFPNLSIKNDLIYKKTTDTIWGLRYLPAILK
jgi:cytochrome P450